jgi:predicted AlkP superfamily pyrophosphatase or phosphodiesterase
MINSKSRFSSILVIAWMAFSRLALAADVPRVHHVFIISFDQGDPALIEKADMPVFHEMAHAGACTWEAYTIIPSLTLPSHTSMLTGVGPQKHQVLWNDYEPEKGLVKVPTIFSIAKEKGLVTAMFVGKEKFKHLNLPRSVDLFVWPQPEDNAMALARAFAEAVPRLKPNLCFVHFRDPDSAGHKFGAESPEKLQALEDCDHALKTIRDTIGAAGLLTDSVRFLPLTTGLITSRTQWERLLEHMVQQSESMWKFRGWPGAKGLILASA